MVGPLRLLVVEPLRLFHQLRAVWGGLVEPLRLFHPTGIGARCLVEPLRLFHPTGWRLPDGDADFSLRWRLIKHDLASGIAVAAKARLGIFATPC